MELSSGQLVETVALTAAAISVLAKTIYELVRILRRERRAGLHGTTGDDSLTRLAAAVTTVMESRSQREERLIDRLLELETEEAAALGKLDYQLGAIADGLRAVADRLERQGEDIRRLTERVGWQRLSAVGT